MVHIIFFYITGLDLQIGGGMRYAMSSDSGPYVRKISDINKKNTWLSSVNKLFLMTESDDIYVGIHKNRRS